MRLSKVRDLPCIRRVPSAFVPSSHTMNLSLDVPPHPSAMSELDSLSDSDWLDIASGRDSDDNDSLSEQDSDRDEMSSLPRSRRSSISNEDSMSSDVEGWEGFVSDSGDAVIGMYPVPLPSPLGAEPIALGDIPDNTSVTDPAISDEERRVKEALDQSFVGTLSSSRSSAHTSIRDLRLSFPDPLTSSRNDLNRSYETVSSPTETIESSAEDDTDVSEVVAPIVVPPKLEDPGLFTTPVVRHQHPEAPTIEHKEALEIVLYGSSSEIKWKILQQLIEKAAVTSGHVLADDLRESTLAQSLSLVRPSGSHTPFFDVIHVSDRTTECAQLETVSIIATGLSSHFHTTFYSLLGHFRFPSATFLSHCLFTSCPAPRVILALFLSPCRYPLSWHHRS